MTDDITTSPMLEALLQGQRGLSSLILELRLAVTAISEKQDVLASNQTALASNQTALAAKQDDLAVRQENLEVRVAELSRQVEDGLYETRSSIEVFNDRLLSFETWLKRVDRRLHDEILVRTR